jgi:hypothetical protein
MPLFGYFSILLTFPSFSFQALALEVFQTPRQLFFDYAIFHAFALLFSSLPRA